MPVTTMTTTMGFQIFSTIAGWFLIASFWTLPSLQQFRMVPNPDQRDSNGDGEGDACQDDCDLDAIKNGEDICPCDPSKSVTDLSDLVTHDVGTSSDGQPPPNWEFSDGGKQIFQKLNSRAGLAVGGAVFSSVRYTGVMFVGTNSDDDVIGILFGYKDNKNFYTVTSSKSNSGQVSWTFHATKLNITLVPRDTCPIKKNNNKNYSHTQGYWKLTKVKSVTGHPSQELSV